MKRPRRQYADGSLPFFKVDQNSWRRPPAILGEEKPGGLGNHGSWFL